jgi:Family of unknown function (DUF6131)
MKSAEPLEMVTVNGSQIGHARDGRASRARTWRRSASSSSVTWPARLRDGGPVVALRVDIDPRQHRDEPRLTLKLGVITVRSASSRTHFGVAARAEGASSMLILGLILLIIGFVAKIAILWTIGIILLVIGAVLWILGSMGRPVGGRRHYW